MKIKISQILSTVIPKRLYFNAKDILCLQINDKQKYSIYYSYLNFPTEKPTNPNLADINLIGGLWATLWSESVLSTNLFVPAYQITGRLSPNPSSGLDETIATPASAISFFNSKNIPENKRVLMPAYLNVGFFDYYWAINGGFNSATCTAGQACDPRKSLDLTTSSGMIGITTDACIDSTGNIVTQDTIDGRESTNPKAYGGTLSFASPWNFNVSKRMKDSWNIWLTEYKSLGGTVAYIPADIVDSMNMSHIGFFAQALRRNTPDGGSFFLTHMSKIINDPRAYSLTEGNASIYGSLRTQLKLDGGGYTLSDFNTLDLTGNTGGYKLWDFVTSRLAAYYVNDALYSTTKTLYPGIKFSNYDNAKILESDKVPDLNGHKSYFDNDIGNYVAIHLYGEWNQITGNNYKISPTDPTVLIYELNTPTPIGSTSWQAFLASQQKLRAVDRNRRTDGKKLQIWLSSGPTLYTNSNSFGRVTSPAQAENYWRENAYHSLMRGPDPILYFNFASKTNQTEEQKFADIIQTVNTQTQNSILFLLTSSNEKIKFDTKYIFTGCQINNSTCIWRITTDYNTVLSVVIDGQTYNVSSTPGFWYTTDTTKIGITQSNYNAGSKILTLSTVN